MPFEASYLNGLNLEEIFASTLYDNPVSLTRYFVKQGM